MKIQPTCGRCKLEILNSEGFTYDHNDGKFYHWRNASTCKGGARSEGPANTPGIAGATPAASIHHPRCVCVRCKPEPSIPEPEILPVEEKA